MSDLFGRKPLKLPTVCQPASKGCVDCGAPCEGIFCESCAQKDAKFSKSKEKKIITHPEDDLHKAVASWMRYAIGQPGITNPHGVRWVTRAPEHKGHAMINKRTGKRFYLAGQNMRAKGVRPGDPDIEILFGRQHGIELKAPSRRGEKDGGLSPNQVEAHRNLRAAGVPVAVCYSVEEVEAALRSWGIPLRAKVAA